MAALIGRSFRGVGFFLYAKQILILFRTQTNFTICSFNNSKKFHVTKVLIDDLSERVGEVAVDFRSAVTCAERKSRRHIFVIVIKSLSVPLDHILPSPPKGCRMSRSIPEGKIE